MTLLFFDLTVSEVNDAMRVLGHRRLVCDHNDGIALFMKPVEEGHDFGAGFGIQRAGRLIGRLQYTTKEDL